VRRPIQIDTAGHPPDRLADGDQLALDVRWDLLDQAADGIGGPVAAGRLQHDPRVVAAQRPHPQVRRAEQREQADEAEEQRFLALPVEDADDQEERPDCCGDQTPPERRLAT
jgi:hypothetical protein